MAALRAWCVGTLVVALPSLGLALSTWQPIGPWSFRTTSRIAVAPSDNDRIYAWQAPGLVRSDDAGDTWTVLEPMKRGSGGMLAICPTNPDFVLTTLTPEGFAPQIARSSDAGASWKWTEPSAEPRDLKFHPRRSGTAYFYSGDGIFRSRDFGASWQHLSDIPGIYGPNSDAGSLAFHPNDDDTMLIWFPFAGIGFQIAYRSTDGGETWSLSEGSSPGPTEAVTRHAGSVNATGDVVWTVDPDVVLAASPFGLFRSTDSGRSFEGLPIVSYGHYGASVAASPLNPLEVYTTTRPSNPNFRFSLPFRSTDQGDTWEDISGEVGGAPATRSIYFHLGIDKRYIAHRSRQSVDLFRSTDEGSSWQQTRGEGIAGFEAEILRTDSQGGLHLRSFGRTYDAERHLRKRHPLRLDDPWETMPSSIESRPNLRGLEFHVHWSRPEVYLSLGTYRDGDNEGADTEAYLNVQGSELLPRELLRASSTAALNYGTGDAFYYWQWRGTDFFRYRVRRSKTGDWELDLGSVAQSDFFPASAVISPGNSEEVFGIARADFTIPVRRSTDGGVTWQPRSTGLPHDRPTNLLMDPENPAHLLVGFENKSPFESIDGGLSWKERPIDFQGAEVHEVVWDSARDDLFVRTSDGVFVEGTGYWNRNLPNDDIVSLAYSPGTRTLYAATGRQSVWVLRLGPILDRERIDTPLLAAGRARGRLHEPIRDVSANSWQVSGVGQTTRVSIFDVQGRLIRSLDVSSESVDSNLWDGRTRSQTRAAPGVYFMRVETGNQTNLRKVVVTR